MKEQGLLAVLILAFAVVPVLSQDTLNNVPSAIVNGKAVSLPSPPYPAAAKAVGASGAVRVQVLIDEIGDVVSATAVSGHPLLRSAAEKAALQAKFKPTLLQGQPVKVSGIIKYVFNSPMSFLQIGFELALAEKSSAIPKDFPSENIAGNFPSDWLEEKEEVIQLGNYFSAKQAQEELPVAAPEERPQPENDPPVSAGSVRAEKIGSRSVAIAGSSVSGPMNTTKIDRKLTLENLQAKIISRLASDRNQLWYFTLGLRLGSIRAELDDIQKTQFNANELDRVIAGAPSDIPKHILDEASNVVRILVQAALDTEKKLELDKLIYRLKSRKTN